MTSWQDIEENVRRAARTIWGCSFASEEVHTRQIDAYGRISKGHHVAIEVTKEKNINKIQDDINKLVDVRNANFNSNYVNTDCLCVCDYVPTPPMRAVGQAVNIDVISVDEFRVRFLPFDQYNASRLIAPFGSAIDPDTGMKDHRKYVPVTYLREGGRIETADNISDYILQGRAVVLKGEYGTGKSKCLESIYSRLASNAWGKLVFPIAIDLRNCWGLKDRYEIINRHMTTLNISEYSTSFVKAYNDGRLVLLLDGFDEMGVQLWTDDSQIAKSQRSEALSGVRDLIFHQRSGLIICGREHYFDSDEEMLSALGLRARNPIIVRSKDEFSDAEINDFLLESNINIDVPNWLPRKPHTCEFFVRVISDTGVQFTDDLDPVQFWSMLINAICVREAKIHPSFDQDTVKSILVEVAAITRMKVGNVGPLSLGEIQKAFERVVGHAPIDQASILLQRLPGLGRAAADSEDRSFVDTYLLEGLRAEDVFSCVSQRSDIRCDDRWINPLGSSGILILGEKFNQFNSYLDAVSFCKMHQKRINSTLIFDIVSALCFSYRDEIDFGNINIVGAYCDIFDISNFPVKGLNLINCSIGQVILSGNFDHRINIEGGSVERVDGISSEDGLPEWLKTTKIYDYSSVANTTRIRSAKLTPAQIALITILRKTFKQRGSGRKEEALIRGLGTLVKPALISKILNKCKSESILKRERGDSGDIFIPIGSSRARVNLILSELTLSKDPLWEYVADM